ncbi:XisH family protein [Microcoleus sp. FACHB-672]|uniref:XisH family protein n=1 Tax=Microcoleus sp. FACHB-672 TaxID=2692825 RepID=UPI0016876AAE|nr:XisH family protein [Microcoleus sp. FACHB-672]MBD2039085.1 XisH family protein [Microcoleus sp. FACHB-672]
MAKDIYHDTVRTALEKDGWTITQDPLRLTIGGRGVYVDLGAEKLIVAEREGRKIAVEIKSFIGASPVKDLEAALGQYILYEDILARNKPDRTLYLAVHEEVYLDFFTKEIVQLVLENKRMKIIVFDPIKEVVTQ